MTDTWLLPPLWVILNIAVMNMHIEILFSVLFFNFMCLYIPRSRYSGAYDNSIFNCVRNCHTVVAYFYPKESTLVFCVSVSSHSLHTVSTTHTHIHTLPFLFIQISFSRGESLWSPLIFIFHSKIHFIGLEDSEMEPHSTSSAASISKCDAEWKLNTRDQTAALITQ